MDHAEEPIVRELAKGSLNRDVEVGKEEISAHGDHDLLLTMVVNHSAGKRGESECVAFKHVTLI